MSSSNENVSNLSKEIPHHSKSTQVSFVYRGLKHKNTVSPNTRKTAAGHKKLLNNTIQNKTSINATNLNDTLLKASNMNKHRKEVLRSRNDSTQIKQTLSAGQFKPISRFTTNLKNQSTVGPFSFHITQKNLVSDEAKTPKWKPQVKQNASVYKPYLAETQPEYLQTSNTDERKNLQQVKDIHKKFNILLDKKPKLCSLDSKKDKFIPLKLCDENKFSKEIFKKVRSIREDHSLITSDKVSRKKNQCSKPSIIPKSCYCGQGSDTIENTFNIKSRRQIPSSKRFNHLKSHDEKMIDKDCLSSHCQNICSSSKFQQPQSVYKENIYSSEDQWSSPADNFCLCDDACSEHNYSEDEYPCPLHNVIKYRCANRLDTHASSTDFKSQPQHQTYILDERLFPVPIQTKQEEEARCVNNVSPPHMITDPSFHSGRSLITLKSSLGKTSHHKTNTLQKNNEVVQRVARLIPAPTNSLALKNQKGVRA
ncbi:hypothetical protein M8J77_009438 [Diaphorina citri]|nr:hypothetical protein M8J77_009438 [Diaphorina citri]